jgi:hypothetical protein
MGPKAAPAAEAAPLREGANIVYIRCSVAEDDHATVKVNLNCRVDIILDNALKLMLKDIGVRLARVGAEIANPEPIIPKPEGEAGDENTIVTEKKALQDRLLAIQEAIHQVSGLESVELQDEAQTAVCVKDLLSQNAVEALKPGHKYTIGFLGGEDNSFIAF